MNPVFLRKNLNKLRVIIPNENTNPIVTDTKEDLKKNHLKLYCFKCQTKTEVKNPQIDRKMIKENSFRWFLRGYCLKCGRKNVGVVSKESADTLRSEKSP